MNFYLLGIAVLVGFLGGVKVEGWRQDAQDVRDAAIIQKAQEGAAREIAKIEVKNVTIKQKLEKEIHEKPVYLDCKHTPDGLRLINSALTGASDSELPKTSSAK